MEKTEIKNGTEVKRQRYARLAEQTLAICQQGWYENSDGQRVEFGAAMAASIAATELFDEAALKQLAYQHPSVSQTRIAVWDSTSIAAARRMLAEGMTNLVCLNFASARNPGGGFLGGAEAQEENLAKASSLYPSLITQMPHYEAGRAYKSAFYRHDMIYSPQVQFFRDDDYHLLQQNFAMAVITSAAVNAGVVKQREPDRVAEIAEVMRLRARYVLRLALAKAHRHIILGAWGCGVFQNEPQQIARIFMDLLLHEAEFKNKFEQAVFAVPKGRRDKNYPVFWETINDYEK